MKRKLFAGLFLSATLYGCGTMDNMTGGERRVFGGVRQDVEHVKNGRRAAALDVPLSAVGDTVTLPVTAVRAISQSR
jgi:uncharacterized protein YceK